MRNYYFSTFNGIIKAMKSRLIIGNWKSYLGLSDGIALAKSLVDHHVPQAHQTVVICPQFPLLGAISQLLSVDKRFANGLSLGAQDISAWDSGAHTGEVSQKLLCDMGCKYTIIGHSERRQGNQETDTILKEKLVMAINNGITPIFCVGETLDAYQNKQTLPVIEHQLTAVFSDFSAIPDQLIIAYEPIWAIGSNIIPSLSAIETAHQTIASTMQRLFPVTPSDSIRVIYGGSVNADNCKSIIKQASVDGFLVGRASISELDFLSIIVNSNKEFTS
ncbi:MAG: triose-phosphate isomerase [Planctomycetes bacterium]|nr:triose-phosphate isomerase [Planctomycetota bacterium]